MRDLRVIEHACAEHTRAGRSWDGRYWGVEWIVVIDAAGNGVAFRPLWLSVN